MHCAAKLILLLLLLYVMPVAQLLEHLLELIGGWGLHGLVRLDDRLFLPVDVLIGFLVLTQDLQPQFPLGVRTL